MAIEKIGGSHVRMSLQAIQALDALFFLLRKASFELV